MRRTHFAAWTPHCPVCARDRGTAPPLGLADGATGPDGDVLSGILICGDASCRHEYPIVDGIPIIMPELRRHLGERGIELLLRDDLDPAILTLLGDALGPDSWFDVVRQGVSTYAWDAFADLDPAEGPHWPEPGAARRCLAHLLSLAQPWNPAGVERALDLGCAAGRTSFDLADAIPGGLVLGIDGNLALLRLARRAATTGVAAYARRRIGMVYDQRQFPADLPGRDRVDFWACDAAALPFAPARAGLILALNLLDCVADPAALLTAMAAALQPGGCLLLATPFDWSTRATPAGSWIGGHSQRGAGAGAAEPLLRALLTPAAHARSVDGLRVLGTGECAWATRLHDRAAVSYRSYVIALQQAPDHHTMLDSAAAD